ncbi:unnamed protein product [Arabis nemorensis]|uniref:DUF2828 domain-containing protein n=1 Tax=Arabis nemorensis TaxID=586526 RepID=A0A565C687_9BRAS|nr:unnamed protein product [Arabis nemorensis]
MRQKCIISYLSSGNPCLDFFFHVVPDTPKESLEQRLHAAWNHDALTTLKLICNLRGVRGTGKSDKEGFYTAALWLHGYHPNNLACNLESLSNFGYFKDFPELLYRILQGSESRRIQFQRKRGLSRGRGRARDTSRFSSRIFGIGGRGGRFTRQAAIRALRAPTREQRIANTEKINQAEKAKASLYRKIEKISLGKKSFTRYSQD